MPTLQMPGFQGLGKNRANFTSSGLGKKRAKTTSSGPGQARISPLALLGNQDARLAVARRTKIR